MPNSNKPINLLPQEEFSGSIMGRALRWILSTFRMIVVLTEIVVMGAFLSRFYLDARINDLNDNIKQKSAIIGSFSEFEKLFRSYQERLSIASKILSKEERLSTSIETIASLTPEDVVMTSLTKQKDKEVLRGLAAREFSISQLIANLESNVDFRNLRLTQVSTKDSAGQLDFSLEIKNK